MFLRFYYGIATEQLPQHHRSTHERFPLFPNPRTEGEQKHDHFGFPNEFVMSSRLPVRSSSVCDVGGDFSTLKVEVVSQNFYYHSGLKMVDSLLPMDLLYAKRVVDGPQLHSLMQDLRVSGVWGSKLR